MRFAPPGTRIVPVRVNGDPGVRVDTPAGMASVIALEIAAGRIVGLWSISNLHKLARLRQGSSPAAPSGGS